MWTWVKALIGLDFEKKNKPPQLWEKQRPVLAKWVTNLI
jgi:hypothetical protein